MTCNVRVGQELDVGSAAVKALLELDLVLDDEGVSGRVERGGERYRDGMVSSLGASQSK